MTTFAEFKTDLLSILNESAEAAPLLYDAAIRRIFSSIENEHNFRYMRAARRFVPSDEYQVWYAEEGSTAGCLIGSGPGGIQTGVLQFYSGPQGLVDFASFGFKTGQKVQLFGPMWNTPLHQNAVGRIGTFFLDPQTGFCHIQFSADTFSSFGALAIAPGSGFKVDASEVLLGGFLFERRFKAPIDFAILNADNLRIGTIHSIDPEDLQQGVYARIPQDSNTMQLVRIPNQRMTTDIAGYTVRGEVGKFSGIGMNLYDKRAWFGQILGMNEAFDETQFSLYQEYYAFTDVLADPDADCWLLDRASNLLKTWILQDLAVSFKNSALQKAVAGDVGPQIKAVITTDLEMLSSDRDDRFVYVPTDRQVISGAIKRQRVLI